MLALAAIFTSLGFWQLDRARELKASLNEPVVQDQGIYQLSDLTSPEGSLPVGAFGKSVELQGHYIATYKAPGQKSSDGKVSDWEVALMQLDAGSAILVVRGYWEDRLSTPEIVMATKVEATGFIYPSQSEDRAAISPPALSRLDSSLLTSVTDLQLYDGFIVESSEVVRDGEVDRSRVTYTLPREGVPGYYWQHISYVAIWWLMALLVLWAPFYKRRDE